MRRMKDRQARGPGASAGFLPSVTVPLHIEKRLEEAGRRDMASGALSPTTGATPERIAQLEAECEASMALRITRFLQEDIALAARSRRARLDLAASEARAAQRRDELGRYEKDVAGMVAGSDPDAEAQLARTQKLVELADGQALEAAGGFDEAVLHRAGARAVAIAEIEALRHVFEALQHAYLRGAAAAAGDDRTREMVPLLATRAPEVPEALAAPSVEVQS